MCQELCDREWSRKLHPSFPSPALSLFLESAPTQPWQQEVFYNATQGREKKDALIVWSSPGAGRRSLLASWEAWLLCRCSALNWVRGLFSSSPSLFPQGPQVPFRSVLGIQMQCKHWKMAQGREGHHRGLGSWVLTGKTLPGGLGI